MKRAIFTILLALASACAGTRNDNDDDRDAAVGQDRPAGGSQDASAQDTGGSSCDPSSPPSMRNLRPSGGLLYTNPRWSADGTQIAVLSWQGFSINDAVVIDRCGEVESSLGITAELA